MSPTSWSSPTPRSSTTRSPATSTSRIPSTTQPLRQASTWMTTRSASYSQKYTEIAEGVSVSPSSVSVLVDRTGEPVERSDSDHFGFSVRNVKSAQNQFPVITQAERMVDRTGKLVEKMIAEERESSSAQIRTLLNEQRKNDSRGVLRESFSSRTPCSSSRTRSQNSTGRTIAATTRSSSRIRKLLWNYLEDYKNCRTK